MAQKAKFPGNLADELFEVQAKIADLVAREKKLKGAIIDNGEAAIEGLYARATVSHIAASERFDSKAAKAFLTAHSFPVPTFMSNPSTRVACKARVVETRAA